MKLLLPVLMLVFGTAAGGAVAWFLMPEPEPAAAPVEEEVTPAVEEEITPVDPDDPASGLEYARLNNQFIVPIIKADRMTALVVLTLSVEVPTGEKERVFEHEPRLRNALLQVMFDHANLGGFDGVFTANDNMGSLRNALRNTARSTLGSYVSDVLVLDVVRQDLPG